MIKVLLTILALFILPGSSMATEAQKGWQAEIISLISHKKYKEAGEKLKDYCLNRRVSELCLNMASAYFDGEAKLGVESRDIIKAYQYTKLACEQGSKAGCEAYNAAMKKGELIQNVLFEPNISNRDEQLKRALKLGADLNTTTLFTTTLLQKAISEENMEVVNLLLDNGVDVNYRVSDEDPTPLMYAINTRNQLLVTDLLKHGADPGQTMDAADYLKMNKQVVNACDFAQKLESKEILAILKCKVPSATAE